MYQTHLIRLILLPVFVLTAAGRYAVVAGTGDLHIRAVRQEDGTKKFVCLVSNVLNGERKQSDAVFLSTKGACNDPPSRTSAVAYLSPLIISVLVRRDYVQYGAAHQSEANHRDEREPGQRHPFALQHPRQSAACVHVSWAIRTESKPHCRR